MTATAKKSAYDLALRAAGFGVGGWIVENTLFGPRFSALFDGIKVPLLPVYAAGGLAVQALAPSLRKQAWWVRFLAYAGTLSAIELAGCVADREVLGACSWDYSRRACQKPLRGCVDLKHAAAWGALGLVVEAASR
jgi:hypothetical protein